jgi:hypothetical protein
MGEWMYNPHFLDLGSRWRWVVSITSRPLFYRLKNPRYPLDTRLGGPQSRCGRHGEEKILDPTGIRTPTPRSSSLRYPGSYKYMYHVTLKVHPAMLSAESANAWLKFLASLRAEPSRQAGEFPRRESGMATWQTGRQHRGGRTGTPPTAVTRVTRSPPTPPSISQHPSSFGSTSSHIPSLSSYCRSDLMQKTPRFLPNSLP